MESFIEALKQQLQNQVVSGGLILGLVAATVAAMRGLPRVLWQQLKRVLVMTVVIDSRNDLFNAAIAWLDQAPAGRQSRLVSVVMSPRDDQSHSGLPKLLYSPAPGWHVFWSRGRLMWMVRDIQMNLQVVETLKISALFGRRADVERLLQEMLDLSYGARAHLTVLWTVDRWAEKWQRGEAKPKRAFASVILPGAVREHLLTDVEQFFASRQRYADLGIPWRRGYLFYGPPGTGKTSLAFALAGHLSMDLCLLSLTNSKLNDQNIAELLQKTPARSLILIEDVDAFFQARDKLDQRVEISFSGLLNAIDGVAAQEGRIVVLTTNHRDKLDPALIRPGRIDQQLELPYAKPEQIQGMYLRFFPEAAKQAATLLAMHGAELKTVSPAQIQQTILASKDANEAAQQLRALLYP